MVKGDKDGSPYHLPVSTERHLLESVYQTTKCRGCWPTWEDKGS